MGELLQDGDFALEPLEKADLLGQLGGQDLDGGLLGSARPVRSGGRFLVSQVNPAHAAATDFLVDDPLPQSLAGQVNHRRSAISGGCTKAKGTSPSAYRIDGGLPIQWLRKPPSHRSFPWS